MGQIIVVTNQKGGSGKTTVSMQLAGSLARRGAKVQVADADPQGTAMRWASAALDEKPFGASICGLGVAGAEGAPIARELQRYVKDYDYIIVDCPPAVESIAPEFALLVADLALVPIIPSPPDLWAARGIKKLIEQASIRNGSLRGRLILNMVPKTRLARDIKEMLVGFGMKALDTTLGSRTAYRQSAVLGGIVHDVEDSEAAIAEIDAMTDEVLTMLTVQTVPTQAAAQ